MDNGCNCRRFERRIVEDNPALSRRDPKPQRLTPAPGPETL
jgi:hypothetical protein